MICSASVSLPFLYPVSSVLYVNMAVLNAGGRDQQQDQEQSGAEYGIGLMSGILSAAMVNNTIAIIVTCPIAKEIGEKYKIAPKRLASLVDIFACAFIALMPHDGGMLMITALADVSPLNVLKYSFYMFGLIIATCVTIQFGLMDKKN